jgi:hypothetical protein
MPQCPSYELLVRRSAEYEVVAQLARSLTVRRKSAELAREYRELADRLQQLDLMEQILKQRQPGLRKFAP